MLFCPAVAGPLPSASEAPKGAEYSGLLECPMTTRITKAIDGGYVAPKKADYSHLLSRGDSDLQMLLFETFGGFSRPVVDLLKRAVQLNKPIELIVLPYAKWGPEHDKPFPENVFNPHWEPYLPELGGAFRTIAINWKVEYRPACLLQAIERIAPLLRHKVDPAMANGHRPTLRPVPPPQSLPAPSKLPPPTANGHANSHAYGHANGHAYSHGALARPSGRGLLLLHTLAAGAGRGQRGAVSSAP